MSHPVALLAIADASLRQRLGQALIELRWQVVETSGGADALAHLETGRSQAVILDKWLPDLDVNEFFQEVQTCYPNIDLISVDGSLQSSTRPATGRRGELMHAIRISQEMDGVAGADTVASLDVDQPVTPRNRAFSMQPDLAKTLEPSRRFATSTQFAPVVPRSPEIATPSLRNGRRNETLPGVPPDQDVETGERLPELLGTHPTMVEVSRRVRLVAGRRTPVLIQGPSGTGKELVAKAIHRLSPRAHKPLVILNCAAIPESLLEAELFGHTRGAFTGAVQGRIGRIEAADGGTLFLDEIGEMPLGLQSKLLRFLEAGEIQRVGNNEIHSIDVRVLAATHQPLARRAREGLFRADVFYRLAVFTILTPALKEHATDIAGIVEVLLQRLCEGSLEKKIDATALQILQDHSWPGNVRELSHALERACILSGNRDLITAEEIELERLD